jgi:hypothetical protein
MGDQNEFSNIADGKERFSSVFQFICANGVIPRPAIIRCEETGATLLDGNHRVAALTATRAFWRSEAHRQAVGRAPEELQPVWLVTGPSEGEYEPDPITALHGCVNEPWPTLLMKSGPPSMGWQLNSR